MIQKNRIKNNLKDNKNNEILNQRRQNFKNIYTQIKTNIKTSFSRTKQKPKINITNSKKLTENLNKKNNSNNMNYERKSLESRNNNKTKLGKIKDEGLDNGDNDIFFNKTEKDIKLLYNKFDKNLMKKELKSDVKNNGNKNKDKIICDEKNYYSNKNNNYKNIDSKNYINDENYLFLNKKRDSYKGFKILNMSNKNKSKEKDNESKRKPNSLEKISKLYNNKKRTTQEEIATTKNASEQVKLVRFTNNEIPKLDLNFNKGINLELKTISEKNTKRTNTNNLSNINENELNFDVINQITKIKKSKVIKQIKKLGKKNHSMTINNSNKILFLNDTIKDNIYKAKKKYSIINIYNYPNIKNNIPHHKNFIFDSADKENDEKNIKNEYSNMNCTCFNFNDMNITNNLDNKLNATIIPNENKNTPKKNHSYNNSFNKLFSQEKIMENFCTKPIARLKKRFFNSPSEKNNEDSTNIKEYKYNNDKKDSKESDSLEINERDKINDNNTIKELFQIIKILNHVINAQKKIIEDQIIKQRELQNEIEQKNIEIKNYKNACLKLMIYIKEANEFIISNEKNQKRNLIESQLLKENKILKEIIILPFNKYKQIIYENNPENNLIMKNSNFNKMNINENASMINFYKSNQQNIKYNENLENVLNPLYNIEIISNPMVKKREKSYENRKKSNANNS